MTSLEQRRERQTFVTYGELLSFVADKCLVAEGQLRSHGRDVREPFRMMIEEVADAEYSLALDLKQYAAEGPTKIVATRIQYMVDTEQNKTPDTVGSALKVLLGTNDEIEEILKGVAERFPDGEMQDELTSLRIKVESVARRISMIRVTAEDV